MKLRIENLENGCNEFSPKDVDVSGPLLGRDPDSPVGRFS